MKPIPYSSLSTLFLDMGNTLISIDYEWVRDELAVIGIPCDLPELQRAEAAARPEVSAALERLRSTESDATFRFYLSSAVGRLEAAPDTGSVEFEDLLTDLMRALQKPGRNSSLWNRLIPGVSEALQKLQEAGLKLAVVSNSDGSVEETLTRTGLRPYLETVVESHYLGHEKPDPRIFEHALEQVGATAASTLHVGDLFEVDVRGAWAAGLHGALVDPFDDWGHADCERVPGVPDLADLVMAARN